MQCTARTTHRPLCVAMILLATAVPWTQAQQAPSAPAPAAASPGPGSGGGAPEFKWPDFAMVTKDMQVAQGLVTLYYNRAGDPTKDHTRLLCQIPRTLLKQDLLLATSFSRGGLAGYQGSDYLIRFEMLGRQVVINVPDLRYVQTPGRPVTDAISRTYNDAFLASLPIITMAPNGDPVVDLGGTLLGTGIVPISGRSAPAMPRRELSQYTKIKSFPDNTLIEVELAMGAPNGPGQRIGVFYALRRLPDLASYRPRLADERVGYFTTIRQDWNTKYTERENMVRYVNRWDLKKKDPSLEMSPPDKPIVFIVEKTVPFQWRKYVADGIREWNKAYEKLGIVDAIVVQQQTEDNEFAQVDPEDARYNFFRWIVTGNAFAMGPSRADPRTGQILDADIIFDDSFVRAWSGRVDTFGPHTMETMLGPEITRFFADNPEFLPAGQKLEGLQDSSKPQGAAGSCELVPGVGNGIRPMCKHSDCTYAAGMQHQIALMQLAVAATNPTKKIPEKLLGEAIKEIVTHEVGHTLGLRHNFKASAWLSLEEIKRRRDTTDEPTVSSVMDYNPLLFFGGDDAAQLRHFITPTVGPYDFWAIEYGYRIPANEDEKTLL
ncbi:MAG: zinc-dependent metalloprotease, partial [Bacillota bacterium]